MSKMQTLFFVAEQVTVADHWVLALALVVLQVR
jgi:hypothetical protein